MGDLVNLEEYKQQKKEKEDKEELEKLQQQLDWLKEKLDNSIERKYIPVYPNEEYYHWHPPHLISYQEYESEVPWGEPQSYEVLTDWEFDWENS